VILRFFSEEKTLDTTFRARKDNAEGRGMIKEDGGLEGDGKNQLILDTSFFQPLERHCRLMQRNEHEQQMSWSNDSIRKNCTR
jgi:hypothetical protein